MKAVALPCPMASRPMHGLGKNVLLVKSVTLVKGIAYMHSAASLNVWHVYAPGVSASRTAPWSPRICRLIGIIQHVGSHNSRIVGVTPLDVS
jgi:hypothetical protein